MSYTNVEPPVLEEAVEEKGPAVTDINAGDMVICMICRERVVITSVDHDKIRHFDADTGSENSCYVGRDQIIKTDGMDEDIKKIFNLLHNKLTSLESEFEKLKGPDTYAPHHSRDIV